MFALNPFRLRESRQKSAVNAEEGTNSPKSESKKPQALSEGIEWEARRVVAAFEITNWKLGVGHWPIDEDRTFDRFEGWIGEFYLQWCVEPEGWFLLGLSETFTRGYHQALWQLSRHEGAASKPNAWRIHPGSMGGEIMARGLYRLGFEEKSILSQLPELSAHEKLELALSMPAEFRPRNWQAKAPDAD